MDAETITNLNASIDAQIATVNGQIDAGWTLFAATLVFLMHAGFALLESGSVHNPRNVQSVLLKNVMNVCISGIAWACIGYGLAFGEDNKDADAGGGYFGTSKFFVSDTKLTEGGEHAFWFFQFTFC